MATYLLDAFTPFPVAKLDDILEVNPSKIRPIMLVAGIAMAAFAYGLQWYSSVVNLPPRRWWQSTEQLARLHARPL